MTINGVTYDVASLLPPKPASKSFNFSALKHLQQVSGFPLPLQAPPPVKAPSPQAQTSQTTKPQSKEQQPLQRCISEAPPELLNHRLIVDDTPKRIPQHSRHEELKAQSQRLQEEVSKLKAI